MNICMDYNLTVLSQTLRVNFFLRCKGRWIACFVLIQPYMSGTQLFYRLSTKTDTLQLSMSKYQEAFPLGLSYCAVDMHSEFPLYWNTSYSF